MIKEKALELGRQIGQSDEYKALQRAQNTLETTPELKEKVEQLRRIAESLERSAAEDDDPPNDQVEQYETLLSQIQGDARYQQFVAAQANFEKLMLKVNEHIAEGLKKGAESSIITLG